MNAFRDWFLDQLAMYAAYHRDGRNQATHYVGVPLIIFSILVALVQVPLIGSVSLGNLMLGILLLGYVIAVPAIGLISVVMWAALYLLAAAVGAIPWPPWWGTAGACFVAGWAAQFVGHVFEGRRPAFLVNFLQLFMAPAFLVAEAMFAAGFQKKLYAALALRAEKYGAPQRRSAL